MTTQQGERKCSLYLVKQDYVGIPDWMIRQLDMVQTSGPITYQLAYTWKVQGQLTDAEICKKYYREFNQNWDLIKEAETSGSMLKNPLCTRQQMHNMSINDVFLIDQVYYKCIQNGWEILEGIPPMNLMTQ